MQKTLPKGELKILLIKLYWLIWYYLHSDAHSNAHTFAQLEIRNCTIRNLLSINYHVHKSNHRISKVGKDPSDHQVQHEPNTANPPCP